MKVDTQKLICVYCGYLDTKRLAECDDCGNNNLIPLQDIIDFYTENSESWS